ncbi:MAG TPA: universal stress protein, partial [Myxococcus sp.]|nr:universal stress protein [Myxococcus sp.]
MAIVCATNLSSESMEAANVAAALAARLGEPLVLLGILEGEPSDAPATFQARLEAEAARLEGSAGVVKPHLSTRRSADEALVEEECRSTRWAVVASGGWRTPAWRRASMPERMARHGCAPVLTVRRDAALVDWARGRRRLLVMVGVDPSDEADGSVAFVRALREVGPCDIIATYVCSPAEERTRLGIHTPMHVELLDPVVRGIQTLDPYVERVLLREVRERLGEVPGEGQVEIHLEPGYGRRDDHLLHVARERGADLVVVGTHQRVGLQRWWHGSVSAGVMRNAEQSVVCVPATYVRPRRASPPRS